MAAGFLHIAVGVLRNARGEVLICQRPAHKPYPGEWEFPGGKVEPGEDGATALRRELREELGIEVRASRPLIRVRHRYPELAVELDTWVVTDFAGEPRSTEHPAMAWVAPDGLPGRPLLAADRPIVNALRLPAQLVFTPPQAAASRLGAAVAALPSPALLRLRLPRTPDEEYGRIAGVLAPRCRALGLALLVDRDPAQVAASGAAGWHGSAAALRRLRERPVPLASWFGASCHDAAELRLAAAAGVDYAVLGPVLPTPSHPGAPSLGWEGFAELARDAGMPVYAIGGLGPGHLVRSRAHGAHGVAGIAAYWRFAGAGAASGSSPDSDSDSAGIA